MSININWYQPCRKWEDKFDAKGLKQSMISIRCSAPQGRRKVPLHFDGWVLMMDGGDNLFANAQLLSDRPQKTKSMPLIRFRDLWHVANNPYTGLIQKNSHWTFSYFKQKNVTSMGPRRKKDKLASGLQPIATPGQIGARFLGHRRLLTSCQSLRKTACPMPARAWGIPFKTKNPADHTFNVCLYI